MATYRVSERRACSAMTFSRSTRRYETTRDPQDALRVRLPRPGRGAGPIRLPEAHVLLRREGREVNHKRVDRLDSQERLAMRRKVPRRHVTCQPRVERPAVEGANRTWATDFLSDTLSDGRKLRFPNVPDLSTRECLAIHVDLRLTGADLVKILDGVVAAQGVPASPKTDNGPEFTGRMPDLWADFHGVVLGFSEPGKPTDNAFIESFS